MENNTKEETKTDQPELEIKRKCGYSRCNVMFVPHDSSHKYCCDSHRALASRERRRSNIGNVSNANEATSDATPREPYFQPPTPKRDLPVPDGLSVSARFIIDNLKEQRDDWKRYWQEEREARKKLQDDRDRIERELKDYKHEVQLKEIREAKPSGLQGLTEGPMAPFIGPAIQEVLTGAAKMLTARMAPGQGAPAPGTFSGLEGPAAETMSMVASWLSSSAPEIQTLFADLMQSVIGAVESEQIAFFTNVLRFMRPQNTGTYGG